MTLAYLILANKNPARLLRLVDALTAGGTYFFIHIDKKMDETPFKSIIEERENVFFCEHRKIVNRAGFSQIEATMELIREMIVHVEIPDFELIIADDDSSDNSVETVKSYRDNRIKLVSGEHDFINSLNPAMSHAKGKYIARMDAGDIMQVDRPEVKYEFMEKNSEKDGCVGWMQFFGHSTHLEKIPANHDETANGPVFDKNGKLVSNNAPQPSYGNEIKKLLNNDINELTKRFLNVYNFCHNARFQHGSLY
jgi:glycosyltransferase involved in cell wall biosynthesis